jgi:tripartite-type tricarboxylate transporter receptor subunit TctC
VKDSWASWSSRTAPAAAATSAPTLVAKAAPDGLTIGMAAVATHAINPWLYSKMPYNPATDFAPITQMPRCPTSW